MTLKHNLSTYPYGSKATWREKDDVIANLRRELEHLKQRGTKLMEDKDITRFSRERGILSHSDGKLTIPIDEVLGVKGK